MITLYDRVLLSQVEGTDTENLSQRGRSTRELEHYFIMSLLLAVKPDCILELGAHGAEFSRICKRLMPDVPTFAFEANPFVFERYSKEVAETGVEYIHSAVSPEDGTIAMQFDTSLPKIRGNVSVLKMSYGEYEEVEVEATRVDSFLKKKGLAPKGLAAWIDVEGFTLEVLEGMGAALDDTQIIYTEVEDRQIWEGQVTTQGILEYLCSKGFIPYARDFQSPNQYNIIFIREELSFQLMFRRVSERYFGSQGSLSAQLAHVLINAGDSQGGVEILNQAMEDRPEAPSVLFMTAKLQMNLGQLEKAERLMLMALKYNPADAFVYQTLAKLYVDQQRLAEAIKILEAGIPHAPSNYYGNLAAEMRLAICDCHIKNQDLASAKSSLQPLLEGDEPNPDYCLLYSRIAGFQQNAQEAIDYVLKALDADPGHLGAMKHLADIYQMVGQAEKLDEILEHFDQHGKSEKDRTELRDHIAKIRAS